MWRRRLEGRKASERTSQHVRRHVGEQLVHGSRVRGSDGDRWRQPASQLGEALRGDDLPRVRSALGLLLLRAGPPALDGGPLTERTRLKLRRSAPRRTTKRSVCACSPAAAHCAEVGWARHWGTASLGKKTPQRKIVVIKASKVKSPNSPTAGNDRRRDAAHPRQLRPANQGSLAACGMQPVPVLAIFLHFALPAGRVYIRGRHRVAENTSRRRADERL